MLRVLTIISLIAALLAPHGNHSGGHGLSGAHAGQEQAAHHVNPCETEACGPELLLACCDAMAGQCFLATDPGCTPIAFVPRATASRFLGLAAEVLVGHIVTREPPPPRG